MEYISKKYIKLPKRKATSHKGDNGKVLVVGGSKDYVGAVALAGLAALRSGADIVVVAAPERVAWAVNCLSPDLITKKLDGDYFSLKDSKKIIELSKSFDVLLVGNGIGNNTNTQKFIKKIVKIEKLKVIDADGIKAIGIGDIDNAIITPHIRELAIILKNSKINEKTIKQIVNEKNIQKKVLLIKNQLKDKIKNNVILLKGETDIIISKDKTKLNKTGNAGMTKAGTGDVLAGLCAGFLAQSKNLLQSAANAAYFNGLAGDILLKKKKGFTYLASDLVEEIKSIRKN